jgi:antirestriction protein
LVSEDEVIGMLPKQEEAKKKRFGLFAKGGEVSNHSTIEFVFKHTDEKYINKAYDILESEGIKVDLRKKWHTKGFADELEDENSLVVRFDLNDAKNPAILRRKLKNLEKHNGIDVVFGKEYAKGGTTDPKPTAQDILKRLGYNIPQAEESQEEEPRIIRGWVDDEPYYFAKGGMSKDDSPKVYIADLLEYNNGRLVGKWFDLTDYSDGAELMADVQKMLDEQTKKDKYGDVHEEWAVHDYENFPREFYSEYMGEADFDKLISLINDAEDSNLPFDVIAKAMADLGKDEVSEVVEAYFGSVSPSMGNEWRDFAYEYVEDVGGIIGVSNADYYFDYESFGSDERINMGGEAEEEMGYEDLDDTELGEQLVEEVGGIEALDKSTIEMYFDYDKFGRDLQYDFTAIRGEDGDYYFFNSNFKKGGKLKSKPTNEDEGEYVLSEEEKKIIRGYVDDEPYYFAEGGEITADEKKKSLKGYPKLKF